MKSFTEFKILFPIVPLESQSQYDLYVSMAQREVSKEFYGDQYENALLLMVAHTAEVLNGVGGSHGFLTSVSEGQITEQYQPVDTSMLARTRYGLLLREMTVSRGGAGPLYVGGYDDDGEP